MIKNYFKKGFTLIELLVVIGILSVLLAIVLIAINPARQFQQANDTQRRSDVNTILNAVHQYMTENNGNISGLGIGATAQVIGSATGQVDLCDVLVPTYIADLPTDPSGTPPDSVCTDATTYNTGYTISVSDTDSRITVAAPDAQLADEISVTR